MKNQKLLATAKQCFGLFCSGLAYATNENNRVRVKDFKIITEKKGFDTWQLDLFGPDNIAFIIQHPSLKFYSNSWTVKKKSPIAPWFISELPDKLFILAMQWWMRFLGYRTWLSTAEKSVFYRDILKA